MHSNERPTSKRRTDGGSINPRFLMIVAVMAGLFGLFYALAQFTVGFFGSAHVMLVEEGTLAPIDGAEVVLEGTTGDKPGPSRKPIRLKFLPESGGAYHAKATVKGTYTLLASKPGYEPLEREAIELKDKDHKDLGRIVMRRQVATDNAVPVAK
ncbi:MAG: carboxypeptidase regulatory-like domain-containing protein [Planctomycetes bacterium]|nr:carboxypeptidase regulatory-like domain-containing protein [Planctomycetota bacterium]MCC7168909.1 carboxypeptidase regulatory-like domain-containing protein [Planctomycetota bacterium]